MIPTIPAPPQISRWHQFLSLFFASKRKRSGSTDADMAKSSQSKVSVPGRGTSTGPDRPNPLAATGSSWRVIGASVLGASHRRANLPNQDAWAWRPEEGGGPIVAVSVADGHGSAKCFRSEIGARFAANLAVEALWDFMTGSHDWSSPSTVKRAAEDHLPRVLARRWKQAVEENLQQFPVSEEELQALEAKEGPAGLKAFQKRKILAYGSTLVAVAITESFILFLQLGDGDILTVTSEGGVDTAFPADDRLLADETTSLCSTQAEHEFRVGFRPLLETDRPVLVLISTDGYSKSFREPAGFAKVGPDILHLIRSEGLESVNAQVEGWLTQVSERGSGDDITLAILSWIEKVDEIAPKVGPEPEDDLIKCIEEVTSESIQSRNSSSRSEGGDEG